MPNQIQPKEQSMGSGKEDISCDPMAIRISWARTVTVTASGSTLTATIPSTGGIATLALRSSPRKSVLRTKIL